MPLSEVEQNRLVTGDTCACPAQLDLPLLTAERKKKPEDSRVAFYLGQTFELIGDVENALQTYQERIDMGGWQQEVFEAHLRRVRSSIICCDNPDMTYSGLQSMHCWQARRATPDVRACMHLHRQEM